MTVTMAWCCKAKPNGHEPSCANYSRARARLAEMAEEWCRDEGELTSVEAEDLVELLAAVYDAALDDAIEATYDHACMVDSCYCFGNLREEMRVLRAIPQARP